MRRCTTYIYTYLQKAYSYAQNVVDDCIRVCDEPQLSCHICGFHIMYACSMSLTAKRAYKEKLNMRLVQYLCTYVYLTFTRKYRFVMPLLNIFRRLLVFKNTFLSHNFFNWAAWKMKFCITPYNDEQNVDSENQHEWIIIAYSLHIADRSKSSFSTITSLFQQLSA